MILPIMRHVSKACLLVLAVSLALLAGGCATPEGPPPLPKLTQIQVRQLQTREYEVPDPVPVMKAVIAALQDEGFIISTANTEVGLVTAIMDMREEDEATKGWVEFWYGPGMGTYQTTKRFEASATVQKHDDKVRVRINIIAKALNNAGGIIWSQPVYDSKVYQRIFTKIDKSIFLLKQNI